MIKIKEVGFPVLNTDEEEISTRPMGLNELPLQFRIDHEMAIVGRHHERIENAIRTFWGRPECVEYLQDLILSSTDSSGHNRAGFKPEVLSALLNLITLHEGG